MNGVILKGPFLDRTDAARRSGLDPEELPYRPDVLHIGGRWLEEVYFAFQFDDRGLRPEVGRIVRALRKEYSDEEIADYLVRRGIV